MRILVENGDNSLSNVGDVAMLIVAARRLNEIWPDATLDIVTSRPERLAAFLPDARPVLVGNSFWSSWLRKTFRRTAPDKITRYQSSLELEIKRLLSFRGKAALQKAAANTAMMMMSGAGLIADAWEGEAIRRLNMFEIAIQAGKPTAMFGQGIGPITHPGLAAMAKAALPLVSVIGIRDTTHSLPTLLSLGAQASRIFMTGDDALELAHATRDDRIEKDIGVNARFAPYTGFSAQDSDLLSQIRKALTGAAEKYGVFLIPISIHERDDFSTHRLLGWDEPDPASMERLRTPNEVFKQTQRCRVVITMSYHAAVFALAQGKSVVCLANSEYYVQKFSGLANQFAPGCQVLFLHDKQVQEKLEAAIDRAWQRSEAVRPQVLEATKRQIEASREVYWRFHDRVT